MKKSILTSLAVAAGLMANAQVVNDTVSVGATYANQVWYSLANDVQGSAPKNNWDLAFDASGFGSTILINTVAGTMLWNYPGGNASAWSTVDTTGLSTWASRSNSDTSWAYGAIGRYADPGNDFDLDWGIYNSTTHIVSGDSIYIVKLGDGSYRKLMIQTLTGGIYTFKYANVDGTGEQTATVNKATYSTKNFGYYSLQTNAALDREPASANWDLVFGQYSALIPGPYTVTGVLSNVGVQIAKVAPIADPATYVSYSSAPFNTAMNVIGYNWKTYSGSYVIEDSTVYFVRTATGDIWKMIMTGFSGSGTGDNMFSKEKLYTQTSVDGVNGSMLSTTIYPNPFVAGQATTVVYSLAQYAENATLNITDIAGRTIENAMLDNTTGLHQYQLPAGKLQPGVYVISVVAGNSRTQHKLIVQ